MKTKRDTKEERGRQRKTERHTQREGAERQTVKIGSMVFSILVLEGAALPSGASPSLEVSP